MPNYFDQIPDRSNSLSIKWEKNQQKFGASDILPLWIADMDFAAPPAVSTALAKRVQHPVFGYSYRSEQYIEAIANWLSQRHGWAVTKKEMLFYPPGTVAAVNMLVKLLSEPGDEIIVQTPSYPPLVNAVVKNGRHLIENPLRFHMEGYQMDFAQLEASITDKTRLLILCSPHNPTGRVWRQEELAQLAQICARHNITVISDEVHSDLIFSRTKHTPFGALEAENLPSSVTIVSSSKTFNLAGLPQSTLICREPKIRRQIQFHIDTSQLNLDGIFSAVATQAAYEGGELWLESLLDYLAENRQYIERTLSASGLPIKLIPAQATYLAWLDFSGFKLDNRQLQNILVNRAKVGLSNGTEFGCAGEGFFRLNFATSRQLLTTGLERIVNTLKNEV